MGNKNSGRGNENFVRDNKNLDMEHLNWKKHIVIVPLVILTKGGDAKFRQSNGGKKLYKSQTTWKKIA